jgi:hypothetical protein
MALAAVIPAPNPTRRTMSPSFGLTWPKSPNNANGIEADDVLPVSWIDRDALSIEIPKRSQAAEMIRMLA